MEKRADPRNRIGGGKAATPIAAAAPGKPRQQGRPGDGHCNQFASDDINI